jgi:transmembrane sensor
MSGKDLSRLEEAAAWRVRLAEQDLDHPPEFAAWLAADARNATAWQQVQDQWSVFTEHATSPEVIDLRCQALAHAHEASRGRWVRSKRFANAHRLGIVAVIVAVVAGGMLLWKRQPDVYSTRAGERRVVTLADGSQVALDSRSEVRVRYTQNARELTLDRGQAKFDVAHDIERPFTVTAGDHRVIAIGTSFNMDLFGPSLLVTLIEGHVVVASTVASTQIDSVAPQIDLDAGEQVVFTPKAAPNVAHVNLGQTTAWENGEVVFENDTLGTVVTRINRYARHGVVIADPETAQLRISGVFHTGDIDGFVSTIVAYLPVRADKSGDGTTHLARR